MRRKLAINWGGPGWAQPGTAKRKRTVQVAPVRPAPPADVVEAALTALGAPAGQRIICDYPPNALNPNRATAHLRKRLAAKKRYRQDCFNLTLAAKVKAPAEGRILVRLDMFPPDASPRDDDNAESSFKAGRDGIAKALKVDDARFSVERHLHRQPLGCVVFTIIEEAPDAR
jgi:crossover junction endodeoxyribonuclease RusA